jgi:hypothetical protein
LPNPIAKLSVGLIHFCAQEVHRRVGSGVGACACIARVPPILNFATSPRTDPMMAVTTCMTMHYSCSAAKRHAAWQHVANRRTMRAHKPADQLLHAAIRFAFCVKIICYQQTASQTRCLFHAPWALACTLPHLVSPVLNSQIHSTGTAVHVIERRQLRGRAPAARIAAGARTSRKAHDAADGPRICALLTTAPYVMETATGEGALCARASDSCSKNNPGCTLHVAAGWWGF